MTEQKAPTFRLAQIYLIRAVFEHRGNQLARPAGGGVAPQQIQVRIEMEHLNDGAASQVRIILTSNPEDGNENTAYDFMVEVAGIVHDVNREMFPDPMLAQA